jgi:hypothetical protein
MTLGRRLTEYTRQGGILSFTDMCYLYRQNLLRDFLLE